MRARVPLVLAVLLTAGCLNAVRPGGNDPASSAYALDCAISPGAGNASWPEACLALASPNASPSKAEIDLAVNPKDPLNVVVASKDRDPKASSCVWAVAQVTKDGGKSWKTSYVGGDAANRAPGLTGYQCVTDPIMTFDKNGVLYYSLQAYEYTPRDAPLPLPGVPVVGTPSPGSAMILARSKDGGVTWDKFNVMIEGDGFLLYHDYMRMLTNPKTGSVSTIWNALRSFGGPGPGYVSPVVVTTRDGGDTVSPPVTIIPQDAPLAAQFFSGFAAKKDGTVFVTIAKSGNADSGEATDVWIYSSADDSASFTEVGKAFTIHPTPRQHGEHKYRSAPFVEMAIDDSAGPFTDRIYTFWPEWSNNQSDILSSYSSDGGKKWSAPVNVATDPSGGQLFMRPAVGPDGTVHVIFTSQAFSKSELLDQVHAWSTDGGVTWQNQRLTTKSYDGDKGIHQDGFPFIGDYNGLKVAPDGSVHVAFADTATGRAEIAYARILAR